MSVEWLKNQVTANPVFHLHPPKTGGTSINHAVMLSKGMHQGIDASSEHVFPEFAGIKPTSYMSIGVRNPYTRFISQYFFYPDVIGRMLTVQQCLREIASTQLRLHSDHKHRVPFIPPNMMWMRLTDWRSLATGPIKVIRFEHLAQDARRVYGIKDLPHLRKTYVPTATDWLTVYNNHLTEFNDLLADDFQNFGYTVYHHIDDLLNYFMPDA